MSTPQTSNSQQCRDPNPPNIENPSDLDNYVFPWDTQPEDRITPLKCQTPIDRYAVRNDPIESIAYIRQWLDSYLNNPDCLYRDSIKEVLKAHPINVNGVGFYDTSAQGQKPCVYIKYAGSKFQQDFAFDNSINYNDRNATETFYGRHIMGFSVFALSEQYTESLALIEEVRRFLHYLQAPIKRSLCWKKLEVIEMQAPARDETFDCFTSTISCTATFDESWSLKEAAPLLKKIDFTTL